MHGPVKIPTFIGLLIVIGFVAGFGFLYERANPFTIQASPLEKPAGVMLSNMSDTAVTVSWMTTNPTTGAVVYTTGNRQTTAFDERDVARSVRGNVNTKTLGSYKTHFVTVRGLSPSTAYTFKILSGGRQHQDGDKPYQVSTAPLLPPSTSTETPAYGSVLTSGNQPAEGALVFLTLTGSQTLSSIVKATGTWLIPLSTVRSDSLASYIESDGAVIQETIRVVSPDGEANALSDTQNDSPVPAITIGKTYDFRGLQSKNNKSTLAQATNPNVLGSQTEVKIALSQPAQNAHITSNYPLVSGTGIPGKPVTVTLGITKPYTGTATVSPDGTWRYSPTKPLAPGRQSVTMTTFTADNKPFAVTNIFEIMKSGTQVLGDATASGSLVTPSPTLATTPVPTSTLAGEPLPISGNFAPTLLLLILGLGLLAGSVIVRTVY